jgi:dTDP-glucose 4,6-dehydratase
VEWRSDIGRVVVTGAAGFIGSAVVRRLLAAGVRVVIVDKLTYAGNRETLADVAADAGFAFEQCDIGDGPALRRLFARHRPEAVLHLAAETHVDRSIGGPWPFVETNIVGTYVLLQEAIHHFATLDDRGKARFRFVHVSTDEVYGSLGPSGYFTEVSPVRPNSPYAASKASSDHLVRAWWRTYGLPAIVTHCSNNFGPYQYPEKLIPVLVLNGASGKPLPIYGRGENVRDWLFVEDHVDALLAVLAAGEIGETYDIGGGTERDNLTLAKSVCAALDDLLPDSEHRPHAALIRFVDDRPGHDLRYAIDPTKIRTALGWRPATAFDDALRRTVQWYLDHRDWCARVAARSPRRAVGDDGRLAANPLWTPDGRPKE